MQKPNNETVRQSLEYLRDVVIPWMEEHPENVNLDEIYMENDCGTHACLGGWYCAMRYRVTDIAEMEDIIARDFYPDWVDPELDEDEEFENEEEQWPWAGSDPLFGNAWVGDLEDRKQVIGGKLEELERRTD